MQRLLSAHREPVGHLDVLARERRRNVGRQKRPVHDCSHTHREGPLDRPTWPWPYVHVRDWLGVRVTSHANMWGPLVKSNRVLPPAPHPPMHSLSSISNIRPGISEVQWPACMCVWSKQAGGYPDRSAPYAGGKWAWRGTSAGLPCWPLAWSHVAGLETELNK